MAPKTLVLHPHTIDFQLDRKTSFMEDSTCFTRSAFWNRQTILVEWFLDFHSIDQFSLSTYLSMDITNISLTNQFSEYTSIEKLCKTCEEGGRREGGGFRKLSISENRLTILLDNSNSDNHLINLGSYESWNLSLPDENGAFAWKTERDWEKQRNRRVERICTCERTWEQGQWRIVCLALERKRSPMPHI